MKRIKQISMFDLNKSKLEAHLETFLKFFTVEVFAGLIIVLLSYLWLTFVGGEQKLIDLKYNLRSLFIHEKTPENLVVITLDDAEYQKIKIDPQYRAEFEGAQRYSFPRKYLANLVRKIEQAKPKIIAIDVLLDIQSSSPAINDSLAKTLSEYDNIVLCSEIGSQQEDEILPFREYWDRKKDVVGHAELYEVNGKYRFVQHLIRLKNGQVVPSFTFASFLRLQGFRSDNRIRKFTIDSLQIGLDSLHLPYTLEELFQPQFISFSSMDMLRTNQGFDFNFRKYSSNIILNSGFPKAWLRDKIVIIGARYSESKDFGFSPFESGAISAITGKMQAPKTPGVFVQANILQDLLERNYIKKFSVFYLIGFIFCSLVLVYLFFRILKFSYAVLFGLFLIFVFWGVNIWLFISEHAYYLPLSYPTAAMFFMILFMVFLSFYRKESTVDYIQKIWGPYVPKERLNTIIELNRKKKIKPGAVGKAEIITVIFLKLEGIENIIPNADDETLVQKDFTKQINLIDQLINILQNEVVFVNRFQGASERFLGNGILFYFGIPVGEKDKMEALKAVNCAWILRKKFVSLKKRWPGLKRYFPELKIKICVHTGGIVVGAVRNLEDRIEPTLITQIFEEIQASLSCIRSTENIGDIMLTESTYNFVKDSALVEEIKLSQPNLLQFKLFELKDMKEVFLS